MQVNETPHEPGPRQRLLHQTIDPADLYGTKALTDFRFRPARRIVPTLAALALGLGGLAGASAGTLQLDGIALGEVGLTERIVTDRISGVAIGGYDPVAYFAAGRPVAGSADFQLVWNGAAWRFANEGNMAAFAADPGVYAPAFGGYDAGAVGRGVAAAGDPRVFAIAGERLYLFRDGASRDDFLTSPRRAATAEAAWPALEAGLMR